MIVGICKLQLDLSGNCSPKEKGRLLARIKQKGLANFKINIAEVEEHEATSVAVLGFALAGSNENFIRSIFDKMINFFEESEGVRFEGERIEIVDC